MIETQDSTKIFDFSPTTLAPILKEDVESLCLPAGRMVGSDGHFEAEAWVQTRLSDCGCVPYKGRDFSLPYTRHGLGFSNFVGVIPGRDRSLAPILIGAHYDSVIAAPCADDNGAAVAICFAVARAARLAGGLERDLVIAIFDAEEPPYFQTSAMGSIRFYEDQLDERGIHFAMVHDLVGHDVSLPFPKTNWDMPIPRFKDALFMTGAESCLELKTLVTQAGTPKGIRLGATLNRYVGDMSDHGIFRKNSVPYLFFSCGRWAHYHQPTDTPNRLNYSKMARIADLSWRVIEKVDAVECFSKTDEKQIDHTVEYEIQTLKRLVGPALPLILKLAGIRSLKTRSDIEKVVSRLANAGLC